MNRALLLVICDFLLLSLLALANFDLPADEDPAEATIEADEFDLAHSDQDLIDVLKLSLEEERVSRSELSDDLTLTQQALLEREESLIEREARLEALAAALEERETERQHMEEERRQLEEQRSTLEEKVSQAEAGIEMLSQERALHEEEARRSRERALEMERELREQLTKLEESQQTLVRLEERQREAEEANRQLSTELQLSEAERRLIRENLEYARIEVIRAREEKDRVQDHARELAHGVTMLAERSGELAQEVRGSQPKTSANIFSEFQGNQVEAEFSARRESLLGPVTRRQRPRTILVSDGHQTYAIFHLENTALSLRDGSDWERLAGQIATNGEQMPIPELSFLSIDPRIVVVPVSRSAAERFGTKIYLVAEDPFRFPEAVLINSSGNYYGESTFTIEADHSRYLRMPRRIMSRLFGEFSPSSGDLVFSKTDELIGIMVTNEYGVLVDNFLPADHLTFGVNLPPTSPVLNKMRERVERLPARLRN